MSRLPVIQPESEAPVPPAPAASGDKKLYVGTYGCQMNVHDSQRIAGLMAGEGYALTEEPDDADLIVLNSCNVREKAAQKLRTAAGRLKRFKRRNPKLVVALGGCVATAEGQKLLDRVQHVDLVFGPDHLSRLPALVRKIQDERVRLDETAFLSRSEYVFPEVADASALGVSAFITVMKGCDKFCSFCVVPMTRGREVSRSSDEIIDEAARLAARGTKEVVLLGQTVNAYGRMKNQVPFHELLASVAAVDGIERVRFTSPHPGHFSREQIEAFRDVPELCPHMHLPVQSGSSTVLKAMRRGYTREKFLEIVSMLREIAPRVSLTTDIIVGFPGETEADFEETLSLMREVRFHGAYSFAYSERSGTKAIDLPGVVPLEERSRRLQVLQALQEEHSQAWLQSMVGQKHSVLIEGPSKTDPTRSSGRTPNHRMVHVDGILPVGALIDVEIVEAFKHSLHGLPLSVPLS